VKEKEAKRKHLADFVMVLVVAFEISQNYAHKNILR
jgi:hypothetical protein